MKNEGKKPTFKRKPLLNSSNKQHSEDKFPHYNYNKDIFAMNHLLSKEQFKSLLPKDKSSHLNVSSLSNTKEKDASFDNKAKLPIITLKKIEVNAPIHVYLPSPKERHKVKGQLNRRKKISNQLIILPESPKFNNNSSNEKIPLEKQHTMTPNSHQSYDIMSIKHKNRFNYIKDKEMKAGGARNFSFNMDTDKSKERSIKVNKDKEKRCLPYINISKCQLKKKRNEIERKKKDEASNQRSRVNSLLSEQYLNTVADFDLFDWKKQVTKNNKETEQCQSIHNVQSFQFPKVQSLSPLNYHHHYLNFSNANKNNNSSVKQKDRNKSYLSKIKGSINYTKTLYTNNMQVTSDMNIFKSVSNPRLSQEKPINKRYLLLSSIKENQRRNKPLCLPYPNNNNELSQITNDEEPSSFIRTKNLYKTVNILDELSDDISNSTSQNTNNRTFNLPIGRQVQYKQNINSFSLVKLGEKRLKTDSSLFISDGSKSCSSNKTEVFDNDKEETLSPCFAKKCPNFFALNSLTIKVLSTWGSKKWFGLNGIKLLDKHNSSIEIAKIKYDHHHILNPLSSNDESLPLGHFSENNTAIDIYYSSIKDIKSIAISNYKGIGISYGVKDIEIYRRNLLIWKGQLNEGSSSMKIDQIIQFNSIELLSEAEELDAQPIKLKHKISVNENYLRTMTSFDTKQLKLRNITRNISRILKTPQYKKKSKPHLKFNKQTTITSNRLNKENIFPHTLLQGRIKYPSRKHTQIENGIRCKKIKLVLKENYGHRRHIGLAGLQFINSIKEVICIESAVAIGAMPKDIATYCVKPDARIFENLFNGINETVEESFMWLTIKDSSFTAHPFIEIAFDSVITISSMVFWNYNKEEELDKGVKVIELFFDDVPYKECIVLRKGIGEEPINYSQVISFPYVSHAYTEEELEPFKTLKFASMLYEQHYETPYLPTGFVFKFVFLSNWGDKFLIGFNSIVFYDQLGRMINLNRSHIQKASFPQRKDSYQSNHLMDNANANISYLSSYVNIETASAFNPNSSFSSFKATKNNSIYVLFDKVVSLSYIKIINHSIKPERGIRRVIAYCDDRVIFNGEVSKYDYALNKGESVILFTSNMVITKNINYSSLPNQKVNETYKCVLKGDVHCLMNE